MYFQINFANRSIKLESFTNHLQHSHLCCTKYTTLAFNSSLNRLIQQGRSCCKAFVDWLRRKLNKTMVHVSESHGAFLTLKYRQDVGILIDVERNFIIFRYMSLLEQLKVSRTVMVSRI